MVAERGLLAWRMATLHCGGVAAERLVGLLEAEERSRQHDDSRYWRRFHAELGHASAASLAGRFAPRGDATGAAAISEVAAALRSLPWRQRQAFLLRVAVGVPTEVLPEALGLDPQACRTALFDALGQLRLRLDRSPQGDHRWVLSVRDWLQAPRAADEPDFTFAAAAARPATRPSRPPPAVGEAAPAAALPRAKLEPATAPETPPLAPGTAPPPSTDPAESPPAPVPATGAAWLPWAISAVLAVGVVLVWVPDRDEASPSSDPAPAAGVSAIDGSASSSAIARVPTAPLSAPDYGLHADAADVPLALLAELEFYLWLAAEEAADDEED